MIAHRSVSIIDYYHQNNNGSSRIITDVTGTRIENAFYSPFGEAISDTGAVSVTHKYTAQEFDAETTNFGDGTLGTLVQSVLSS